MKIEAQPEKPIRENRDPIPFKELKGFKKKAQYIWDYYHTPFFCIVIAAVFIVSFAKGIYRNIKYDTVFSCAVINNPMTDESRTFLEDAYSEYYGLDTSCEEISIDTSYMIDYSDNPNTDVESSYTSYQKLSAMIAARMLDCVIADPSVIEVWATDYSFANLDEILPEDVLEAISDRLVYYTAYEGEEDTVGTYGAYAIDLSDTVLTENQILYINPPLVSIVINSNHIEGAIEFIKYTCGLEK